MSHDNNLPLTHDYNHSLHTSLTHDFDHPLATMTMQNWRRITTIPNPNPNPYTRLQPSIDYAELAEDFLSDEALQLVTDKEICLALVRSASHHIITSYHIISKHIISSYHHRHHIISHHHNTSSYHNTSHHITLPHPHDLPHNTAFSPDNIHRAPSPFMIWSLQ